MEGIARDQSEATVSWKGINPTLLIFGAVYFVFFLNFWLGFQTSVQRLPLVLPLLFIVQVLLGILMFTPLHDAVHRTASKRKWLNDLILHGTWLIFLNAPQVFKKIHLAHHSFTNQGKRDPDHFTSGHTWTSRWIRSFLLIFYYYWYSVKAFRHSWSEWTWNILSISVVIGAVVYTTYSPHGLILFALWILPSFVSIGILGFLNTAWPHSPGKDTSRIKNTKILIVTKPLQWILFNQNYHLLHHLRPNMPWYDYPSYWQQHQERLVREGAQIVDYTRPDERSLSEAF